MVSNPNPLFESIYRAAPIGIGVIVDRRLAQVNAQICQMLGYDEQELIGRSARILYESEDAFLRVGQEIHAQIAKDGVAVLETRWQTKAGELLDIRLNSTPLAQAAGINGRLFVVTDISAEVAIQKENDKIIASLGNVIAERTQWLNDNNSKLQTEIEKRKTIENQLRMSKKELEETLAKLQRTQSQIIQAEKMASIGQLAAGVAHEINNPTAYVSSNLNTMAEYQEQMTDLLSQYGALAASLKALAGDIDLPAEIFDSLKALRLVEEEIDMAFLREDFPELIAESCEGAERIRKIVADLKDFAHPGDQGYKQADINQGLDSTINIVWNEIKYSSNLSKDYADLPPVKCFPQQINQVFMNLLVNAAQAIEKEGLIKVCTRHHNDKVKIQISDNGRGIPEAIQNKIFDPFFTTKDIGEGTGLGLSLAYSIIEKHQGTIEVESQEGQGTTFTIFLPVA